jgi:hypothetical protein
MCAAIRRSTSPGRPGSSRLGSSRLGRNRHGRNRHGRNRHGRNLPSRVPARGALIIALLHLNQLPFLAYRPGIMARCNSRRSGSGPSLMATAR